MFRDAVLRKEAAEPLELRLNWMTYVKLTE